MDLGLRKRCTDRLSSLPDELISKILSSLPTTKDAVVASISSKKIRSTVTHLTTLDFDDSPISYCARNNPQFIDRFQVFKAFVDNVLQTSQSPRLSKFRLGFGGDLTIKRLHTHERSSDCSRDCYPDLESTHLNAWIGFPLNHCGVREIDLRIHVRKSGNLPSALFACDTLEVLKLDTNLDFELDTTLTSFRLPNLKVLQLRSIMIPEDEFVGRLVSKCPLLEELYMDCWWKYGKSVTISSPSLRKLVLISNKDCILEDRSDLLKIDTPNLECFEYYDILAVQYFVPSMKALVKASIVVYNKLTTSEGSIHAFLTLVRATSNVQHLSLTSLAMETFDDNDLKNELPVFSNLTHLELSCNTRRKWDTMWLEFLMCSPILETLVFPKGIDRWYVVGHQSYYDREELERQSFRTNEVIIPSCCKSHLKRIVIKEYRGTRRDLEVVRFLLKNASVLEELLVVCKEENGVNIRDIVDPSLAETVLKKLPRASSTSLITVQ